MRRGLILAIFIALKFIAVAQVSELGIALGGAVYNGTIDITPKNFLQQTTPIFGIFGKYRVTDAVFIRAQINHTELFADEKKYPSSNWRFERGLNFKTPLTDLAITAEWHFLSFGELVSNTSSLKQISLYALGGVGLANFSPHPFADGNNVPDNLLTSFELKTDNQTTLVVPFGGGIRYQFSNNLALSGEIIGRKSFSAYVDGVKSVGSNRTDYYFSGGLTLAYVFNTESKNHSRINGSKNYGSGCPRF